MRSLNPFHPPGRKSSYVSTQSSNSSESSVYIHPQGINSTVIRKHFQPSGRTNQGGKSLNLSDIFLNTFHPDGRKLSSKSSESSLRKYSTFIKKLIQTEGRTYQGVKSLNLSESSLNPFHPCGRKSSFVSTQSRNPSEFSIYIYALGKTSTFIRKHVHPSGRTYKVWKSSNLSVSSLNPLHPTGRKSSYVLTQSSNFSESSIYIHPQGINSIVIRKYFQPSGRTTQCGKSLNLFDIFLYTFQPGGRKSSSGTYKFQTRSCVYQTKSTNIKDYNFLARYKHGNKRGAGLKLCHWNKGAALLHNRTTEIEQLINEYKPHILGISEANFHSNHSLEDVQINNYTLYLADTLNNPQLNISRVAVYVHKDVVVKVRNDLMTDSFSSIWLEVGLKRQKKFLVSNVYREWQHVNQANQESGTIAAQLSRWESFLHQWETAIETESEIHVLGDVNLNFLDFNNQALRPNTHSARLRPLVDALLDRIVYPMAFLS